MWSEPRPSTEREKRVIVFHTKMKSEAISQWNAVQAALQKAEAKKRAKKEAVQKAKADALLANLPNQDQHQDQPSTNEAEECRVCMEMKRCISLQPCGHTVTCKRCSDNIEICPVCRANIEAKIRVYL
jgi:Zinc finger, C3HC4 type (RING finger)